jgi:hypothetical protein
MSIPTREVKDYGILVYGSPQGYLTNRSQIQLSGADGKTIAFLRFNDPGMFFENDSLLGDINSNASTKLHVSKCVRYT